MMDCEACRDILLDSLDSQRSPDDGAAAHLEGCADCREWWKDARAAVRCLENTRPALMEAPPVSAVWARIRASGTPASEPSSRRSAVAGWAADLVSVAIAAAIIIVAGLGLRAVLPAWELNLPVLAPPSGSFLGEIWVAALTLVLFGMFAGACSAPLLLRRRIHESGRHA